jgi:hypothetical protein
MAGASWTPSADAMDEGVKADQLEQVLRNKKQVQAQSGIQDLGKMMYGQKLGLEKEDIEQQQQVPALRGLLRGNPDIAQTLGYGEGQQPTDQELKGLAGSKILPGVIGKQVENKQPYTLKPGEQRFSGQNQVVAEGPRPPGVYDTPEEAHMAWRAMIMKDPSMATAYRPQIMEHPSGMGYKLGLQSNEPLSQGLPFWIQKYNDPATPPEEKLRLTAQIKQYADVQYPIAYQKAAGGMAGGPKPGDVQAAIRPMTAAIAGLSKLDGFTEGEKRSFVGFWNSHSKDWASAGQEMPIIGAWVKAVGPQFATDRYQEFQSILGQVAKMEFSYGGKQLTPFEAGEVQRGIPTGREKSYAEFAAKMKYIRGLMEAERDVAIYQSTTPKAEQNTDLMDKIYHQAAIRNGIDIGKGYQALMSPDDRLKAKFNANR